MNICVYIYIYFILNAAYEIYLNTVIRRAFRSRDKILNTHYYIVYKIIEALIILIILRENQKIPSNATKNNAKKFQTTIIFLSYHCTIKKEKFLLIQYFTVMRSLLYICYMFFTQYFKENQKFQVHTQKIDN